MLRPHNRAERGLPAANTPRVRRPRDPRLRIAHGERSRRRVCRLVPGAAFGREVFLLVPAVRPRLAGALLGRRIPQLRALALAHRALRARARRILPAWPARSAEPRLGTG